MSHKSGLTCNHMLGRTGLCESCKMDYEDDPESYREFGAHPVGVANWVKLRSEMASEAAKSRERDANIKSLTCAHMPEGQTGLCDICQCGPDIQLAVDRIALRQSAIAEASAFPDECAVGMTYSQWLVGQALAGAVNLAGASDLPKAAYRDSQGVVHFSFDHKQAAILVLDQVEAIIREMARRDLGANPAKDLK